MDTTNRWLVARQGDSIHFFARGKATTLDVDEAINLAAWIIILADSHSHAQSFAELLDAINATMSSKAEAL